MKHLIIVFCILLIAGVAQAATDWRPTNQATVNWDIPFLMSDGVTPVWPADIMTFNVHIKNEDGTNVTPVGTGIQCCSHTISFPLEGRFYVGVSTVRLATTGKITESPINWSDDITVALGGIAFGYEHYLYILAPVNLSPQ